MLEALAWQDYSEQRERWELTRLLIATQGGELAQFPDYVSPEEGYLSPEAIEEQLDSMLARGAFRM